MSTLVQRKKFNHPKLAEEAAAGFSTIDPSMPGVSIKARAIEVDGEWWVYVTQEGEMVTGDEPLLPGYEPVG